jgi:hypothetical protein
MTATLPEKLGRSYLRQADPRAYRQHLSGFNIPLAFAIVGGQETGQKVTNVTQIIIARPSLLPASPHPQAPASVVTSGAGALFPGFKSGLHWPHDYRGKP